MPRSNRTFSFSLPPEMAERVDRVAKQQGRSRPDLLREALVRYVGEWEWRGLVRYGERTAREKGIRPEDVAGLVVGYRAEVGSSGVPRRHA